MKITQELFKKSAIYRSRYIPPRQKLDLSRFIKVRHMSQSIELVRFRL